MKKSFKKVVAVLCAIALVVTSVTVSNTATKADQSDAASYDFSSANYIPNGSGDAANTDVYKLVKVDGDIDFINNIQPWNNIAGIHIAFNSADLGKVNVNGVETSNFAVQGAGMLLYLSALTAMYSDVVVYKTDGSVMAEFYAYNKNGTESTEVDPDAPVTTPAPTTTTALQAPGAPAGLVANINDLKTNYTIAWGNVATATSYKLYVDGDYVKDITNGEVVTIEQMNFEAGKTYVLGVTSVNAAGESADMATVQITVPGVEETTAKAEEETSQGVEFDPSTLEDSSWKSVTNSTTLYYYVHGDAGKVTALEVQGNDIYMSFSLAAVFQSVTLNGESITPEVGAFVRIPVSSFSEEYNKLVVVNCYGTESVTVYIKKGVEPETTTVESTTVAPKADGEEILLNTQFAGADNWNHFQMNSSTDNSDGTVDVAVAAKTGGDNWSTQLVQQGLVLEEGKWYVATVTITSDVDKNFQLLVQNDGNTNGGNYVVLNNDNNQFKVEAGQTVQYTVKFKATGVVNNCLFGVMMGYISEASEAANVTVSGVSLKGYTDEPDATTGAVVIGSTTSDTYAVTIDGVKVADIEAGQNYTFPENSDNGYYDGTNAYAAGSTITVNNDITVTSIGDISVAMAYGAGIKLDADNDTSGIRFQAKVTADSDVLSAIATGDSAIKSGMLITARDIYENNGADLTVDNYAKYYAKNISNAGWMSNQPEGTFSGSIVNIAQSNYIREFIAKAYVTITYADGTSKTVYSGMSEVRSINYVASAIKKAGYVGLSEAEKAIVDSYLAVK